MKKYDRIKAVEYARKWALDRNPKFYDFSKIGGDCTNYISQCLYAGCSAMNYSKINGWYYKNLNDRSASWTSVKYLQKFLLTNSKEGPIASIRPISKLEIGDIIQFKQPHQDFSHTLFVSKKLGDKIYVCAHSRDVLDAPFSIYFYERAVGIHILGVNV